MQDLPGALSSEEVKAALGLDCIQDRHWKIQVARAAAAGVGVFYCDARVAQGCSAFTGAGLLEGITWVVGDVAARVYTFD